MEGKYASAEIGIRQYKCNISYLLTIAKIFIFLNFRTWKQRSIRLIRIGNLAVEITIVHLSLQAKRDKQENGEIHIARLKVLGK